MKTLYLLLITLILSLNIFAQTDTSLQYKKDIKKLTIATSVAYVGSYATLFQLWYANQPQSSFHFFDDNDEWMQIDKIGHGFTSFAISETAVNTLRNIGMKRKKAIIIGGLTGLICQTPIEIFDGFVSTYGASWGDEIANASGSGLVIGQYLLWDEIRIHPNFLYHHTSFPNNSPKKGMLGEGWYDYWLKDYNGQTYWLSFDIHKFIGKENKFPKWLNVAIGTGASNMFRAEYNDNLALNSTPYRRYFLSLDINLSGIESRSKTIKTILKTINYIRIPLPTLEYNSVNGFNGHWMY